MNTIKDNRSGSCSHATAITAAAEQVPGSQQLHSVSAPVSDFQQTAQQVQLPARPPAASIQPTPQLIESQVNAVRGEPVLSEQPSESKQSSKPKRNNDHKEKSKYCPIHEVTSHSYEECRSKNYTNCQYCKAEFKKGEYVEHLFNHCSGPRCFKCGRRGHMSNKCNSSRPNRPYTQQYSSNRNQRQDNNNRTYYSNRDRAPRSYRRSRSPVERERRSRSHSHSKHWTRSHRRSRSPPTRRARSPPTNRRSRSLSPARVAARRAPPATTASASVATHSGSQTQTQ